MSAARDRWEWVQNAREAVALATQHGWHVFLVTNQAGIARGLYGQSEVGFPARLGGRRIARRRRHAR